MKLNDIRNMNDKELNSFINSISNNKTNNKQQELSKERAECIANKFNSLIKQENANLKQTLNEIKKIITECKMLMPHEFDWDEQVDNILQIINKTLGDDEDERNL